MVSIRHGSPRRARPYRLGLVCAALALLAGRPAPAQFLYVNNNAAANSISAYTVNLGTGALTAVAGSPFATGGAGGFTADIDSIATCQDLVFASNGNGNSVSVFRLSGVTGALTPLLGSPFPTGACPTGVACTADGTLLFVGDFCANTISIFDVDPLTGTVAPNASSPYVLPPGWLNPFALEVDDAGAHLFVTQDFSGNVAVFDIDGGGALSPVPGAPFLAGGSEHGAVLSPNGAFYYVANLNTSISGYTVGGGGALTAIPGSPFLFSASNVGMTDDGKFLLAASYATNRLGVFSVNPVSGVPTAVAGSPFATDTVAPAGIASAFGYVFVANGFFNTAANSVSAYRINTITGALTGVPGSPFARGVASAATGIAFTLGAVCGNGTVEAGEECDDGNTVAGDCCSATCAFEDAGSSCADGTVCNGDEICDGAGICQLGTPLMCDDGNPCTPDVCDDVGGCLHDTAPHAGCVTAPKSVLLMKQNGGSRDKLVWKWIKGGAVTLAQFANPTASSSYALCLYSGGTFLAGADLLAGGKWAAASSAYQYTDPSGTPDGVLKALLKSGIAGKTKVLVKGKGNNLPDPALGSLVYPVTAQLVNTSTGFCVGASYGAGNVVKTSGTLFKAKTP